MSHRERTRQTPKPTGYTPQVMLKIAIMALKVKISAVKISRLLLQVIDY
jgi:hypothetical protein